MMCIEKIIIKEPICDMPLRHVTYINISVYAFTVPFYSIEFDSQKFNAILQFCDF